MASLPGHRDALPGDRRRRRAARRRRRSRPTSSRPRWRAALGAGGNRSRHDRARGRLGAHAPRDQQEPDRGRDPARRRVAGRRRRRRAQALRHGRAADRDRRRRRRHRRAGAQAPRPPDGGRAAQGRAHPGVDQPVRAEAVDAVPVGADGGPGVAQAEARRRASRAAARIPAVQVETESPREAYLQTLLSRGDRRVAAVLERLHARPGDWWPTLRGLRGGRGDVVDPDRFVHRAYGADELLPWDFIDHAVDKRYLLAERRKALRRGPDPAVRHRTPATAAGRADGRRGDRRASASTSARSRASRRALAEPHGRRAFATGSSPPAEQAYCEARGRARASRATPPASPPRRR